jgi:hypothetical protein
MGIKEITTKNHEIADIYTKAVSDAVGGVLLSGSNAWGADYAVTSSSDIDLLIAGTLVELEKAIERLKSERLIDSSEEWRFETFRKLHGEGRAEQFSTIATYADTKVSLDFMPWEVVETICELCPMTHQQVEGVNIRTVKEFRINPPRSTGYSVDDLSGQRKLTYHPKFEKVEGGLLAATLVDARTDRTYFMGVISFFFTVHPIVLLDKNGKLEKSIKALQTNIAQIMAGQVPTHVTRQERMSVEMLKSVKKSLSQA